MTTVGSRNRYKAYLLDSFIVAILWLVILMLIGPPPHLSTFTTLCIRAAILILADLLYFVCFEQSSWQATPGKRIYNMKVVDGSNNKISFARSLMRYVIYAVPGMTVTFVMCMYFAAGWSSFMEVLTVPFMGPLFLLSFLMYFVGSQLIKLVWCVTMLWTPEKLTMYDILTYTRVRMNDMTTPKQKP